MPANLIEEILERAKELEALRFGEFKLSAGRTSTYYFDGRLLTLDPKGAHLVATAFLPLLKTTKADAIAGPTLGADPIVAAVAVTSHLDNHPIHGLLVRKEQKDYGTGKLIEGSLKKGLRVGIVDDTCSSGASLFHAIEAIEKAGCKVVKVLSILDRNEGGGDELRRRGYDFSTLLIADGKGGIVPA
ncbi:MAG: orotate phosphoribosyltransferase [Chloroflexi bacterium]|nr:orotate phosphoribosyltransferase [Chloroflexota bacterium]